jgi:hypothetical protein
MANHVNLIIVSVPISQLLDELFNDDSSEEEDNGKNDVLTSPLGFKKVIL